LFFIKDEFSTENPFELIGYLNPTASPSSRGLDVCRVPKFSKYISPIT